MGSHYEAGNVENYTIGGSRFDFNELLDATTTPKKYNGFVGLGNVVESPFTQELTELEHFTAKTGSRARDRLLTTEIKPSFTLTLDELNAQNIAYLLRSSKPTDVAAGTAVAVTDEPMRLNGTEVRSLKNGINQAAIVVKSWDGLTTHVVNVDYTIVDFLTMPNTRVIKGIKRIAGAGITDGDDVKVSYTYDSLAHKLIVPSSKVELKGQIRVALVSDTGNEMWFRHDKCILTPEGDLSLNAEDWTTMQLKVALESDADQPSYPYGRMEHYGVGTNF